VLENATDGSHEAVAHAHHVAVEIKAEAAQPQPNPSRLKKLLLAGIMAGAAVLDQPEVTDLVQLASQALQMF
jgi:hypothetical protein